MVVPVSIGSIQNSEGLDIFMKEMNPFFLIEVSLSTIVEFLENWPNTINSRQKSAHTVTQHTHETEQVCPPSDRRRTCAEEEEELCKPSLMALLPSPPDGAAIISPVSGSSTIAPPDDPPPDESELW